MFTDKQSLILCAIVIVGFILTGMFGILDNYAIAGALIIVFLVVVLNLLREIALNHSKQELEKQETYQDGTNKENAY